MFGLLLLPGLVRIFFPAWFYRRAQEPGAVSIQRLSVLLNVIAAIGFVVAGGWWLARSDLRSAMGTYLQTIGAGGDVLRAADDTHPQPPPPGEP